MKVFWASVYLKDSVCSCCPPDLDATIAIVANSASEALGFALEECPQTAARHWTIVEINTNRPGVFQP